MKRKEGVSKTAVVLGYLALLVGGFSIALVVLKSTSLPDKLGIVRAKASSESKESEPEVVVDPTVNDQLKDELKLSMTENESLRTELYKTLDENEIKEKFVSSLEVKSREGELDFTEVKKEIDLSFLQGSVQQNKRLLAALSELKDDLVGMKSIIDSITLVRSNLASEEAKFRAREDEFKQALDQRLSVTKEIFLYLFTLKFIWGAFTGYARSHYPYLQRDIAFEAGQRFKQESKALMEQLTSLRAELETRLRSLETSAMKVADSVISKERPKLLTYFSVNFLKPIRMLISAIDDTREQERQLSKYKERLTKLRDSGASFTPQYTPKSYVKTLGQAFFKFEDTTLEDSLKGFKDKLSYLGEDALSKLVKDLADFLNRFVLEINQVGFLSRLADGGSVKEGS